MNHRNDSSERAARFMNAPPPPTSKFPVINFDASGPPPSVASNAPPPAVLPFGPPSVQVPPSVDGGVYLEPQTGHKRAPSAHSVHSAHSSHSGQSQSSGGVAAYGQPPAYGQHLGNNQFQRVHPQLPLHASRDPNTRKQLSKEKESVRWTPPSPTVLPTQRANKKAVIIGCNYANTNYELQGCIHDAKNIEYMLITQFGFKKENIRLLTDDGATRVKPTKDNIFSHIQWLIHDVQAGDSLFFHFSGHGSQKPDYSGDERDGLNETLLPCDFRRSGQIVDDDINERLVNPLPRGVYLHAIIDACHSGTAMDLEYFTKRKNGNIEWRSEGPTRKYKGTSGGIAVLFSACADSQVAQDTDNLTNGVHTGAATHAFIEAVVENGPRISYLQVLSHMYRTMEKLCGKRYVPPGVGASLLNKLADGLMTALGFPNQTPQLSSNIKLNLNETLHI